MAQFKYIGTHTKDNGKVDVKIGKTGMPWYIEFLDVEPNVTIIEITDERQIRCLQNHKDMLDQPPTVDFEQIS